MTTPTHENWLIAHWHYLTGIAVTLAGAAKLIWYRIRQTDSRLEKLEARMPPIAEGKMLATKKHVEDCHERVKQHHDDKHDKLMESINAVHKRIDDLYKLLVDRSRHE